MRYSKIALLIFGLGLALGLAVVSAELRGLARAASAAMALGLALIPLAILADWRRAAPLASLLSRFRRKPAARRAPRARAGRRPGAPASPSRFPRLGSRQARARRR